MKILAIDLERPAKTEYIEADQIGVWLWSRSVDGYAIFIVGDDRLMHRVEITETDIRKIQKQADETLAIYDHLLNLNKGK
jgi:hypothetical protein